MSPYPIIISFVQTVRGQGFIARVHGDARVLIELVENEWICSGVEPGGLSEAGNDPRQAGLAYRLLLGQTLNDLAAEARNLVEFRAQASMVISTVHRENLKRWDEAVAAFRCAQEPPADGVEDLPRKQAESVRKIVIETKAMEVEDLPEYSAAMAVPNHRKAA